MHFASVETHSQCFKTHWKCSSTHLQCVENALQRKNASTLFSLSLLFPNRVTNGNSCFIVSSRLSILLLCSHRNNRTCLRDELYANGKLKEGIPGEPCEDDLTLSTGVESISSIKSSTTVFYSQTYRGITRRNYHIDTNAQEEEIRYQQTEVFFMVVKDVDSAALAQMPKGEKLPIQHHATLGFPVNHIAPISKPLH